MARCGWAGPEEIYIDYHDTEWGMPEHDDRRLFEFLLLEGAQAGLSWVTVLRKRERYRQVFAGFDPRKVARFAPAKVEVWMRDPGLIRHRGKLASVVPNARAFRQIAAEHGSFARWLWSFVDGRPIVRRGGPPRVSPEAIAISKELKKRGLKFVGPTIIHAMLQAVGVYDEHAKGCFRAKRKRSGVGSRW
mgnify:FL=1